MKKYISCRSPSKLNLFLNIKGKREDGFHNIETVLEKIPVYDKITLEVNNPPGDMDSSSDQINVEVQGTLIPQGKNNTAFKVASIFVSEMGIKEKIKIKIFKNIPVRSGMGGASSNAAMVLRLLDRLFETELSHEKIISLGKQLGTDAPFFLKEYNFGFGKGKGDEIEKLSSDLTLWHLLAYPKTEISTPLAYKWFDEIGNTLTKNEVNVKLLICGIVNNNAKKLDGNLYNSFEKVIYKKNKLLSKIRDKLIQFDFRNTLLTGSGSTIYSLFFSKEEAIKAKKELDFGPNFPCSLYGPIRTIDRDECKFNSLICDSGYC